MLRVLAQLRLLLALVTDDVRRVALVLEDVVLAGGLLRHVPALAVVVRVDHEIRVVYGDYLVGEQPFFSYQFCLIKFWR